MKRKHILSLILSLLMLFSFSVSVFAEGETSELKIDMTEGRQLWNEYIKQLEPYKNDETIYDEKIRPVFHNGGEEIYSQLYGNKNEFIEKSQYEKILWLPTLFPAYYCPKMADPSRWSEWKTMISVIYNTYKRATGSEEISESYQNLMAWHFDYYVETKKVFNFVDTFGTEIKEPEELTSEELSVDISESYTSQNIQLPSKAPTESNVAASVDDSDLNGASIFSSVVSDEDSGDFSQTTILLIVVVFVLCGVIIGMVVYIRKKK